MLLRTIILDPSTANVVADPYINNSILAAGTIGERLASNFLLLGKYLQLLVYPHPLSYDYSFQHFPIVGWNNGLAWLSLLLYVGLIGGGILWSHEKNPFGVIWRCFM